MIFIMCLGTPVFAAKGPISQLMQFNDNPVRSALLLHFMAEKVSSERLRDLSQDLSLVSGTAPVWTQSL